MSYIEASDAVKADLADGFCIVYRGFTDTYHCLAPGQTLEQRLVELQNHQIKPDFTQNGQIERMPYNSNDEEKKIIQGPSIKRISHCYKQVVLLPPCLTLSKNTEP